MDEPGWSWPAWKFGMKRDDLFTKLHDQYNTFASTIQDPEAFHHDVYEISNAASTTDEFHRLLADRKQQRLRELNDSLESASLEIIANPRLIGTQQWQYALQLFRTKSLDSLVRYFASYLPDDHPWHHPQGSTTYSTSSTLADEYSSDRPFFIDTDEKPILTHEPISISTSIPASHLPPSPRSMTMCSDSSAAASPVDLDDHKYALDTLTPARTLSFSEPESEDLMVHSGTLSNEEDDETSQVDDADSPSTSISDISDSIAFSDCHSSKHDSHDEEIPLTQPDGLVDESEESEEPLESETPTPRSEKPMDSYVCVHYSKSSSTTVHGQSSPLYTHVLQEYVRSSRRARRDGSPGLSRRSPELGRVQKPLPDPLRIRPNGRRRVQ